MKKSILLVLSSMFLLSSCNIMPLPDSNVNPDKSSTAEKSDYEAWLESTKASDYNKDGNVDEKDFDIYNKYRIWRESDDASDLNGDTKINFDDYSIYVWSISEDVIDYNKDGKINSIDYEVYTWADSDDAADYNNDRFIDYLDYSIFKQKEQDFKIWLDSGKAKDNNKDGVINLLDYILDGRFGKYAIHNYEQAGTLDMRLASNFLLSDFRYLANKFILNYECDGLTLTADDSIQNKVTEVMPVLNDFLAKTKLTFTNDNSFNTLTRVPVLDKQVDVALYFSRELNTDIFTATYSFTYEKDTMDIKIQLIKLDA